MNSSGTSVMVQLLRLHTSTAWGTDSIPGWGTRVPHVRWPGQKNKIEEKKKNPKIK